MTRKSDWKAEVDERGRLVLPGEARAACGLTPGARVPIDIEDGRLRLGRPEMQLAKVYLEPTTLCNLSCRMCIRNSWSEPGGSMTEFTFHAFLDSLRLVQPPPQVIFSGFGEPLMHPSIGAMVTAVKRLGAHGAVVTNGTLLTSERSAELIDCGLDRLWVSLDGAGPESYEEVRPGASLSGILENLSEFNRLRRLTPGVRPDLGIVFVAMRRNIGDLPSLVRLGARVGASRFMVTNVLPHTADMTSETLYRLAVYGRSVEPSRWCPEIRLPNIDVGPDTRETLYSLLRRQANLRLLGSDRVQNHDRCPFIEDGAVAIGWDGSLSPCLTLLHDQVSYLDSRSRSSHRYVIGNVGQRNLQDLWQDVDHTAFRDRVRTFDFSPCTDCGGCQMSEANEEDCFGNAFPTCGGCLWAQGVLQCP